MFEHYDDAARRCIVLTQEEARRLGHPEIGAEHLLLGIARIDAALVGTDVEPLRASVVALEGIGDSGPGDVLQFTPEALAALEGANEQALARGHTVIGPPHLLLSVLDADGVARRVLRETELIVADVRARADAAARTPARGPVPAPAPVHDDAMALKLMLAHDTPGGRLLRAHGIDEAAVDAALGSGAAG
jgi:ATP-dependent Clp protease ATP-binding subunit ClpA